LGWGWGTASVSLISAALCLPGIGGLQGLGFAHAPGYAMRFAPRSIGLRRSPPPYNEGMRTSLVLIALLGALPVWAQTTVEREGKLEPRKNQKIEHIRTEDKGNRIDEVRVGGQVQSVTVQPKQGGVPAYELQPDDGARSRPAEGRSGFAERKQRVWNVFGF